MKKLWTIWWNKVEAVNERLYYENDYFQPLSIFYPLLFSILLSLTFSIIGLNSIATGILFLILMTISYICYYFLWKDYEKSALKKK